MFSLIRQYLDRRIIKRSYIRQEDWSETIALLPLLEGLSQKERHALQELSILFMHRKAFEGAHGLVVTRQMAMIISLQACLPILYLGLSSYDGWLSVIVYPADYVTQRMFTDEFGVVHQMQSNLSGEAWLRGPVVLDWNEAASSGEIDGHNLVIHEFVHKLDMQNGSANGFPPLHTGMDIEQWLNSFTLAYEHIQHQCKTDGIAFVDCYAATSPAEFFAVVSEVFFERPAVVRQHYAEVYEQLRLYYRQDPLNRLG